MLLARASSLCRGQWQLDRLRVFYPRLSSIYPLISALHTPSIWIRDHGVVLFRIAYSIIFLAYGYATVELFSITGVHTPSWPSNTYI